MGNDSSVRAGKDVSGCATVCVFDLDHTLIDSPFDQNDAAREMKALLERHGLSLPPHKYEWAGPELIEFTNREAAHLIEEVIAIPNAHEHRAMEQAKLEPFAMETLSILKQSGFATAVWTNNNRFVTVAVLSRLRLEQHIDLVITRDDVVRVKPDPEGLSIILGHWPLAKQIVVVGDSWVDGMAAQAGGFPFIAYRGNADEMVSRGVNVTAWISSLSDLPAVVF